MSTAPAATRSDLAAKATGLTSEEVQLRHEAGQNNRVDTGTSRPVSAILRANLFTVFNAILFAAMAAVLAVGDWRDAVFGIVLILNLVIGIVSELRSKLALDRLAVLTAPTTLVLRDGQQMEVPSEDLVVDDVVELRLGDQVPADGTVVTSRGLSVDESALTGESRPVQKVSGDKMLSGTSVVAGSGTMLVQVVGAESWAQKITAEAKKFSKAHSEIQDSVDRILRWITLILPVVIALLYWSQLRNNDGDWRAAVVLTVAGVVGMIPQGLVLLTSMNFGLASAILARRGVLVQELPAVEILARVDALCLDKTGTITTGKIRGRELVQAPDGQTDIDAATAEGVLKLMVSDDTNETASATMQLVQDAVAPQCNDDDLLPFNSTRKWSALSLPAASAGAAAARPGTWLLGAPEILLAADDPRNAWAAKRVAEESEHGRRTVVLAFSPQPLDGEELPQPVAALTVVVLEEDIRSDAKETLEYFEDQGVRIKIISGDAPGTVGAIAKEVGLKGADGGSPKVLDARTLPPLDSPDFVQVALETDVFGRVTPEQKQGLVLALQRAGHTVAMTGDGVNDALALKTADLGIAMGNAAPATKAVARLVLVNGQFSVLPGVVAEGRRIIANMERVSSLFLTKTTYAILLAIMVAIFGWAYPFLPRHLTYIGAFTIGVPGFFLSLVPNQTRYRPGFLRRTLLISVPSGIILGTAALAAYLIAGQATLGGHTAATLSLIIGALTLLTILAQPWNPWRVGLIVAMAAGAVLGVLIPLTRNFFALEWPAVALWALIFTLGAIAAVLVVVSYCLTARWRNKTPRAHPHANRGARYEHKEAASLK